MNFLNVNHISGRPNSAPKLTIDTQYIARESRALAVMTLVEQAAANEFAASSESESVEWSNGADCWTSADRMATIIVTIGILVYLVSMWWNAGIATTVSNSTQTLEEGCNSQDIPPRILIVRNGKAAHWTSDCPFLF